MGRTALVYVPSAVVLAVCWLRLESPRAARDAVVLLVLALLPALAPTLRLRLAAAVVAALVAARVALDVSPFDEAALWQLLSDGALEFYDVSVPFRPGEHPEMHGALLLGLFASALLVALAIAARRPFLAVLALVVGAGWPATLVTDGQELVLGTAILAAALWTLAALSARSISAFAPAAVAGVAVVALAGGAAATDAVARDAVLRWERWDLYDAPATPVGVDYVWDAQYAGLDFPDRRTVVLRIEAPDRAQYWRATTLDAFSQNRWFESLVPVMTAFGGGRLPDDGLVPDVPQEQWLRQEVTVVGLLDDRLVSAAPAVQLRADGLGDIVLLSGGVARVAGGLETGQSYTVWSAVRQPRPEQIAQLPADYPEALDPYLDIETTTRMLPFRDPGRAAQLRRLWTEEHSSNLQPYRPLVEAALRVTRQARTPYAAVVALEDWFRSTGGFVYDEQPAQTGVAPPLVEFVTRTKAGYCQHYAGAMALMLRYLGIPARVAVGFTSGRFKDGIWTVTDREAHAWVEVWFPGQGWLSFDPTPGRGTLSALYTLASDSADAVQQTRNAAQRVGGGLDPTAGGDVFGPGGALANDGTGWRIAATVAAVLALLVLAIGLLKLALRRFRSLTSDGRRRAAAYRNELADFLRDQGLDVPASATLDDLQRVLATELGVDGTAFVDAAGAARYGPPDGIERSLRRARRELRSVLKAVRARLSTAERLRGWLAVRSLRRA